MDGDVVWLLGVLCLSLVLLVGASVLLWWLFRHDLPHSGLPRERS